MNEQASIFGKQLTDRETTILVLIAEDYTTQEQAMELGLSPKTCEWFRSQLYKKTGCNSQIGLVRYAISKGFVKIPVS